MRKKLAIIMVMLVLVTTLLVTTVSASSFTATMTPSRTTVAESNEIVVTIRVSNLDVGTTGINTFEGVLSYSTQIFETINADSIEGNNGWQPTYNQDTGKIMLYKPGFLNEDADIVQITFKTKTNVTGKTGDIKLTDIKASNTGETIEASSISTRITVGTISGNNTNFVITNSIINGVRPTNSVSSINNTVSNTVNNTADDNKSNIYNIYYLNDNSEKEELDENKIVEEIIRKIEQSNKLTNKETVTRNSSNANSRDSIDENKIIEEVVRRLEKNAYSDVDRQIETNQQSYNDTYRQPAEDNSQGVSSKGKKIIMSFTILAIAMLLIEMINF